MNVISRCLRPIAAVSRSPNPLRVGPDGALAHRFSIPRCSIRVLEPSAAESAAPAFRASARYRSIGMARAAPMSPTLLSWVHALTAVRVHQPHR